MGTHQGRTRRSRPSKGRLMSRPKGGTRQPDFAGDYVPSRRGTSQPSQAHQNRAQTLVAQSVPLGRNAGRKQCSERGHSCPPTVVPSHPFPSSGTLGRSRAGIGAIFPSQHIRPHGCFFRQSTTSGRPFRHSGLQSLRFNAFVIFYPQISAHMGSENCSQIPTR